MSAKMKKLFAKEMANMDAAGLLRNETPVTHSKEMQADFGAHQALNFLDNDFLGWRTNDELVDTAIEALTNYRTGSTSSRTIIGTLDLYKSLEEKLSEFLFLEDCMVFPSSYLANISLFDPLTNERDVIFLDEMTNTTLVDGVRLSNGRAVFYKNKDDENLEYHLKCSQNARFRIIATDAVFNSNGELANLSRMQELKETYDATTVIDDSLGLGILGDKGRGTFNHLNLQDKQDLVTGSFAYGLGNVSGGFIGGDRTLINWLRQTARPYIQSEPISPVNASIVMKALDILERDSSAIEQLNANTQYLKDKVQQKDWTVIPNEHAIISIVVGGTLRAQKIVEYLFEKNILVSGLCYPNTPEGASLIRIHVSANHSSAQIDTLVSTMNDAMNSIE